MDGDSLNMIERQIAELRAPNAPEELRAVVLGGVEKELRAARWDRLLARAAAAMLFVGVGLNAATTWYSGRTRLNATAGGPARDSLVRTTVIVAEATDAPTARKYARQVAAVRGRQLSDEDAAAIDAAVEQAIATTMARDHKG
jgi:hypothetical protein